MVDKSPLELSALDNASVMGGEYLESIGKAAGLTMLSVGEWMTFVEVICTGWEDGKQQADSRLREELERLTVQYRDDSTVWNDDGAPLRDNRPLAKAELDVREVTGTPPKPPF